MNSRFAPWINAFDDAYAAGAKRSVLAVAGARRQHQIATQNMVGVEEANAQFIEQERKDAAERWGPGPPRPAPAPLSSHPAQPALAARACAT